MSSGAMPTGSLLGTHRLTTMAMIVTVLKAMWATIEGPSRPVRQASEPRTTPKPASPRNCSASKCTRANTSAVTTIDMTGARRAARARRSVPSSARSSRPRKKSSSTIGTADADEHSKHDETRSEGVAGERLGRMTEARVEVVHERHERRLDDGHEQVLRRHADDDPERHVRPGPQRQPEVLARRCPCPCGLAASRQPPPGRSAPVGAAARRVATTAAPDETGPEREQAHDVLAVLARMRGCRVSAAYTDTATNVSTKPATMPSMASSRPNELPIGAAVRLDGSCRSASADSGSTRPATVHAASVVGRSRSVKPAAPGTRERLRHEGPHRAADRPEARPSLPNRPRGPAWCWCRLRYGL